MRGFITGLLLMAASGFSSAQYAALKGLVTDVKTKETLIGSTIFIEGTSRGTISDFNGTYTIEKIPPGTYTIRCSFISYETEFVQNIILTGGQVKQLDFELGENVVELQGVEVVARANRGSESMLLLEQKNAVEMHTAIGAQEISRKGASNAETALTKISGVTKQEGTQNVFVRGLGDRYNSTSLNKLPLPSDNPEYKNISLEIFSSEIINNIEVNKTYNPSMYGDMGGANLNISSKELLNGNLLEIGLKGGVNSGSINSPFKSVAGANRFGIIHEHNQPISDVTRYSFTKSYLPGTVKLPYNLGLSFMGGKSYNIRKNKLSILLIGNFNTGYNFMEGEKAGANTLNVFSQQTFNHSTYKVSQLTSGNVRYEFGENQINSITYNCLLIAGDRQRVSIFEGQDSDLSDGENESIYATRQQENKNVLVIHQLLSTLPGKKFDTELGLSYNNTAGNEPDRRSNFFILDQNGYRIASEPTRNSRYFQKLKENDFAAFIHFTTRFGKTINGNTNPGRFDFGYNGRYTSRAVGYFQFNHNMQGSIAIDPGNPDLVFSQNGLDKKYFYLEANVERDNPFRGESYNATRFINSGFLNVTYSLTNFSVNAGLRFEAINQDTDWDTKITAPNDGNGSIHKNFLLPAFNLKYNLTENNILRFAASKTYTLPQFKEIALFNYEDVDFVTQGNPNLKHSDNYNIDLKWEQYFNPGEILAVGGFYKIINNPINRTSVASAASTLSFLNTGSQANVAGVEIEFQKNIFLLEKPTGLNKLAFGINASYLYSTQDLTDPIADFTNNKDALQGASPFLLNTDLTWFSSGEKTETTASLVANYFRERIYSIGTGGLENVMEKGVPTLDFIVSRELSNNMALKLLAKNILNREYTLTQYVAGIGNDVVVNTYKKGIKISIGITYNF